MKTLLLAALALFAGDALAQDWGRYVTMPAIVPLAVVQFPTVAMVPAPLIRMQVNIPSYPCCDSVPYTTERFTPALVNKMNREYAGLPPAVPWGANAVNALNKKFAEDFKK